MAIEIVDFPINSMVIFHSYVKLPEGTARRGMTIPLFCKITRLLIMARTGLSENGGFSPPKYHSNDGENDGFRPGVPWGYHGGTMGVP